MDYRCQVRTLLRTLGYAASLSLGVSAAMAGAPKTENAKLQHMLATPFWAENINPNAILVVPGGEGEWEAPAGATRTDPCTAGGDANGYDRPPGMRVYPSVILGQFNLQEFYCADDFTPAADGDINQVCWNGWFSNLICDGDMTSPDRWDINFYDFTPGTGLPGALLKNYKNYGGTPNMTVTQGPTGLPVGINPSIVEHAFSAALDAPYVHVLAGTCYYVELFQNTNRTCFYLQGLSYEPTLDPTAEGNRSFLRRDNQFFPAYAVTDFINIDMVIKIGFTAANTLAQSNEPFAVCFYRPPPDNDDIGGVSFGIVTCNAPGTVFDNTYATHNTTLDPYSCRKSTTDPLDQTAGDVWFKFTASATSAAATLCGSDVLGGLSGGDALMAMYRLTVPANGENLANLTQVGCSDDACAGGFSEINATGLTVSTVYYLRISSFTPVDQGIYTLNVSCPIPVAANDLCTAANVITQAEYSQPLGVLRSGQTRTATTDGNVRACGGAGHGARGVWYKLTGRPGGSRILLSTDQATSGSAFDTQLEVYCGVCDASGAGLNCVAYNDDKSDTVVQSELDFCARSGVDYWILVAGYGTAAANTGDFTMLIRELRDTNNNPLACCDGQICDEPCDFEIPLNAIVENGEHTNNTTPPSITTTEPCAIPPGYTQSQGNVTQFNDACSLLPPAGEDKRYGKILEGQTISGNLWSVSSIQARDRDWFLFEEMEPNQARTIVRYGFASEGPLRPRFYDWGAIVDFGDCNPALGFVFTDLFGCPQEVDRGHVFEGSATDQYGKLATDPAHLPTMGFLIFHLSNGDGYPCGTNTRYWLTLKESFGVAGCTATSGQVGDDEEDTVPTFDGTGGTDGFTAGEPCYDVPPTPPDEVARKAGCGADPITDGEFLTVTPNTWMHGKVESKIGSSGATRDIDYYKFTISDPKAMVGLEVLSAYVMTALITDNNCDADAQTFLVAATRGHCVGGGADATDIMLLNGNGTTYILYVFATDSFVAVGSGALFANYFCTDPIADYRVLISASPLPDCSATPICSAGSLSEAEICTGDLDLFYDACAALADTDLPLSFPVPPGPGGTAVATGDNDGCSASVFAADQIDDTTRVCGTLFSIYEPYPDDVFSVDQDYWTFEVKQRVKLTYSLRADGAVRALVADTGAPLGDGSPADNGGSNCYDADNPLRVMGGLDAGQCVDAVDVVYLEPGVYSIIISTGTMDDGLSVGDYSCGMERSYSLGIDIEALGTCCVGNDCMIVTQSECNSLNGINWIKNNTCGDTYSIVKDAYVLVSIAGAGGAVQVTGLGDDDVVMSSMGAPFRYYGKTYLPSDLGVSSNGYIVLGNDDVTAVARHYPNAANPNAMIAGLLADWDCGAPGASVWVQTTGAVGSEVTVIEWNNVALLENFNSRATFQIRLTRTPGNVLADQIEFCYGTFVNIAKADVSELDGDPITMSSGIEDGCGYDGVEWFLSGPDLTGNRKAMFVADQDTKCYTFPPPCCPGDADGSGVVNFADITSALVNFNNTPGFPPQGPGDADCNGTVNFADITSVLVNFNNVCP